MDPMLPQLTAETLFGIGLQAHIFKPNYSTKPVAIIFGPQCGVFADCYDIYAETMNENEGGSFYYPYGEGETLTEALSNAIMKINRIPNSHVDIALTRVKSFTNDCRDGQDLPDHGYLLENLPPLLEE